MITIDPICLSYYVYEQVGDRLENTQAASGVSILGTSSTFGSYHRDSLLNALNRLKWGYKVKMPTPKIQTRTARVGPGHCTWALTTAPREMGPISCQYDTYARDDM